MTRRDIRWERAAADRRVWHRLNRIEDAPNCARSPRWPGAGVSSCSSTAPASDRNDATLADIALLVDLFWIGGTKLGALLGEAIVVCNPSLTEDFAFHLKQRGGMLAKGRLLGIQFQALFGDSDLFTSLARHANAMGIGHDVAHHA